MALPASVQELRFMLHGRVGDILDLAAGAAIVGTLAEILPPLAAFFGLVYTLIRIYESETVQKILNRKKS